MPSLLGYQLDRRLHSSATSFRFRVSRQSTMDAFYSTNNNMSTGNISTQLKVFGVFPKTPALSFTTRKSNSRLPILSEGLEQNISPENPRQK
jgi:hypothetical protein